MIFSDVRSTQVAVVGVFAPVNSAQEEKAALLLSALCEQRRCAIPFSFL